MPRRESNVKFVILRDQKHKIEQKTMKKLKISQKKQKREWRRRWKGSKRVESFLVAQNFKRNPKRSPVLTSTSPKRPQIHVNQAPQQFLRIPLPSSKWILCVRLVLFVRLIRTSIFVYRFSSSLCAFVSNWNCVFFCSSFKRGGEGGGLRGDVGNADCWKFCFFALKMLTNVKT